MKIRKVNESVSKIEDILNDEDIEWVGGTKKWYKEGLESQKRHDGKEYLNRGLVFINLSDSIKYAKSRDFAFIFKHDDCLVAIKSDAEIVGLYKNIIIIGNGGWANKNIICYDIDELKYVEFNEDQD